jgi:hypothetical protein
MQMKIPFMAISKCSPSGASTAENWNCLAAFSKVSRIEFYDNLCGDLRAHAVLQRQRALRFQERLLI